MRKYDPASRYQLVDQATMLPGTDFLTKQIVGPFIDTGRDVEFSEIGRVYISVDNIREMAQNAGLFDHEEGDNADSFQKGFDAGYAAALAERETIDELARDIADRLRDATARVERPADVVEREIEEDDELLVFVTPGAPRARDGGAGNLPTPRNAASARQAISATVDNRPSRLSVDSGDELLG